MQTEKRQNVSSRMFGTVTSFRRTYPEAVAAYSERSVKFLLWNFNVRLLSYLHNNKSCVILIEVILLRLVGEVLPSRLFTVFSLCCCEVAKFKFEALHCRSN